VWNVDFILLGLAAGSGGLAIACSDNQCRESLIGNDDCQYKGFQQRSGEQELVVYSGRDKN